MKFTKKQMTITSIAAILIIAVGIGAFFLLNSGPSAKTAWDDYIKAWEKKDYESMYNLLDNKSKSETDHDTFINKYTNIYNGIDAENLKIETKDIVDGDGGKTAAYHFSADTLAGNVSFDQSVNLVKEDDAYKISWSYAQIFPQMQNGDGIQISTEEAKRGSILDRNGKMIATDDQAIIVGVVPGKIKNDNTLSTLAKRLDISVDSIKTAMSASWVKDDLFVPVKTISKDTDIKIDDLSGVTTQTTTARVYPYKEICSHLSGYVQIINAEELEKHKGEGYDSNSLIGKTGLESIYEKDLRGQNGVSIFVVRDGNVVDTIAKSDVKNGKDIKTTIDVDVQKKVYEQLKKDQGAGVVMQPKTGEVLALVSTPSYDPNDFALGMTTAKWNALNNDKNRPLENRFTGLYTPGSTFKAFTAAAALDSKTITASEDMGQAKDKKWQKDSSWGDYFVKTTAAYDGKADLQNALIYSDNTYFAKVALKMGISTYTEKLNSYGFNDTFDFPFTIKASSYGEESDLKKDITLADTGYGQGKLQISPLHLTAFYASFENNGSIPKPYLIYQDGKAETWKKDAISSGTVDTLKKALTNTYNSYDAENPTKALGKTGTAQVNEKEIGWLCSANEDYAITLMVDNAEDRNGSLYVTPLMKALWRTLA